jgi:TrmH family RNA methyltransferase
VSACRGKPIVERLASAADLVASFRAARRDPSLVVLEGLHALKHALRFGAEVVAAASPDMAALAVLVRGLAPDVAADVGACVRPCDAATFALLAPVAPSTGVIALARRPHVDVSALLVPSPRPVVVLEAPRHLGNVGAAIRVAAAADAAGLLVVGTVDPFHPTAVRGAAGLQFALPCARVDALPPSPRPLAVLDALGEPLPQAGLPRGALVAFGTERGGLGPDLRARADRVVAIPMRAGVSSLNLATAVAVALYHTGGPPELSDRGDVPRP